MLRGMTRLTAAYFLIFGGGESLVAQDGIEECVAQQPDFAWTDREGNERNRKELCEILLKHRDWEYQVVGIRNYSVIPEEILEHPDRADLSRLVLNGVNLTGVILGLADLAGADLSAANLSGVGLTHADLSGATLIRANLTGAHLVDAELREANLSGAILTRAHLAGADLNDANLSEADLSSVPHLPTNLSAANLIKADLSKADLAWADLSGANLNEAKLYAANLSDVRLSGANLSGADLFFADLIDADLRDANLTKADLTEVDFTGSDLSDANLEGAILYLADLSSTTFQPKAMPEPVDIANATLAFIRFDNPEHRMDRHRRGYECATSECMQGPWGVDEVALAVVSHRHFDHHGGMDDVLSAFSVERVLGVTEDCPNRTSDDTVRRVITDNNITVTPLSVGTIEIDGVTIRVLPQRTPLSDCPDHENNNSVVIRLEFGMFSMLFTGDAEEDELDFLVQNHPELLDADVLKASHHGSHNGFTDDFLDVVTPTHVVISAGVNFNHRHPRQEAVDAYLEATNDRVFCTNRHGTVRVYGFRDGRIRVNRQLASDQSCVFDGT